MKLKIGIKMFGFEKTHTIPFNYDIPNYTPVFIKESSLIKRWSKYIKRQIYITLKRQKSLELCQIQPEHSNILWVNISAPSLGDSLMDLSSRVMLKERKVDLFTDKKNASLYYCDTVFTNIFSDKKEVNKFHYDLVIIDSYSSRSINIKADLAPSTPFVGMFGHYNGPEVNRVLFSFHRMNQLLGYINEKIKINKVARASISICTKDQKIIKKENLPNDYITIAIGGEWRYRTYNKWDEVIKRLLIKENNLNIVIVGSDNAIHSVQTILDKFPQDNIFNCVAKFTFNQSAKIISQSKLLLCCDGGLMHAANAVKTPVVALFSRLTAQMQLTDSVSDFSLFDKSDVNNILIKDILQKYGEASSFVDNHPRVE